MSIHVDHLTKKYGDQHAVDDISFTAAKGKITGFLGPNGAGKSTTMKIATGYLGLTSGTVQVGGINVVKEPLKVKHRTGYLPEHNPLYLDMYVREYLGFIASAYRIRKRKGSIDKMIDLCGLKPEKDKKIRALSKGYRQRVGLAQALIHDPEVLILDEPTSGLDPNQLVAIREVIKAASYDKTVILSTHIMQEVEALCDQVVIIKKGKIVADDTLHRLKAMNGSNPNQSTYKLEFEKTIPHLLFEEAGLHVTIISETTYTVSALEDPRKTIMKIIGNHDLPLLSISREERSLEGVFQALTNY